MDEHTCENCGEALEGDVAFHTYRQCIAYLGRELTRLREVQDGQAEVINNHSNFMTEDRKLIGGLDHKLATLLHAVGQVRESLRKGAGEFVEIRNRLNDLEKSRAQPEILEDAYVTKDGRFISYDIHESLVIKARQQGYDQGYFDAKRRFRDAVKEALQGDSEG